MEKELAIKDQNSFTIHGWMRTKLNLSGNALMIYSIIFGFSQDAQSAFYGTRQYLSDFIGASRPTVDKALNELCELGYIIKESVEIKNVLFNNFKINFKILDDVKNNDTYKETLQGGKETLHNDNKEYNKELNNIDNKYIEKENIKEKADYSGSVIIPPKKVEELTKGSNALNIFHHWNESNIIQHRELTTDIRKQIDKVLKEYSVEQIKIAISHYAEALHSDYEYCSYKWSLEKFLKQDNCLKDFLDDGSKWINYLEYKNKKAYSNKKELSKETSYPNYKDKNYL